MGNETGFGDTRVTTGVALYVVSSKVTAEEQKTWECKKEGYFLGKFLQSFVVTDIIFITTLRTRAKINAF